MATISLLTRLVNGVQRQVDLSTNTLWVQDLQLNNSSGYTLAGTTSGHAGSSLIGDDNSYSNFTPASATVKGAHTGIDTALGTKANTALSNLASTAVNVDLDPGTDNTLNLGATTKRWASAFLGNVKLASTNIVADFTNQVLKDSAAANSIEWNTRLLDDATAVTSIDWTNRQLKSGATVKLDWSGTDVSLNSRKLINVSSGTNPNDAVNFSQLTSLSTGLVWQSAVRDPDLVNDSLSTPPVSPIFSLTYIIGATPTGAWTGFAGHAVWWDGANWIDISNGLALGTGTQTAVQVGDRFAVAAATPEVFTFTVTAANATAGDIYTNNGYQFIVQGTIVGGTTLVATSLGFPSGTSGTLTKFSGAGDATIAFSAHAEQIGGGLTGQHNNIATVTGNTPGSFAYSFATPINNWAFNVSIDGSQHFGSSFTYNSTTASWIDFSGPARTIAGNALSYSGNTLNVLFDGTTIDLITNQLEVKNGGINEFKIISSALSGTGGLTGGSGTKLSVLLADTSLSTGASGLQINLATGSGLQVASGLKIQLEATNPTLQIVANALGVKLDGARAITTGASGIGLNVDGVSTEINTNALRIKSTAYDQVTITGGSGTAAAVAQAPVVAWTETAGQTFAANTTYAVRYGLSSNTETVGRVYACDTATSSFDLFWCIGFIQTTTSVTAGQTVTVISSGSLTLKSADTVFSTADTGKALFLQSGGINATTTAPSTTGLAVAKLGIVQTTTSFRVHIGHPFVA